MNNRRTKVAVGLSGGVDSSVAATLLKEKGYDLVGITMEIFDGSFTIGESSRHACYGPDEKDDLEAAASICKKLGIPFHVFDLKKEYRNHVLEYFREEYLSGRTPNPCVVCNQRLKFGFLLEKAREAGVDFDLFATGHYARIEKTRNRALLKRALDLSKDQSYFLYALTPERLSRILFPIGAFTKQQVREMASSFGLETAGRPESQDFVSGGDYSGLFHRGEMKEGQIVDETGNILGRHRGIIHYTIGQRRGLGIASPRPLYVQKIDAVNNRIFVSVREKLFSKGLIATDLNFISIERLERPCKIKVKIRLRHKETGATLLPHEKNRAKILFDEPQISVTPGQAAVFYVDDILLGGGIIEEALL